MGGEIWIITHDAPVLRDEANHISRANLSPYGFDSNQYEQLWLRQRDDNLFELCCIPFRVYGLALKDVVRVTPDSTLVYDLVEQSGHRALRVLFAEGRGRLTGNGRRLDAMVRERGLLCEWDEPRHIAIDVPPGRDVSDLIPVITSEERRFETYWEWSDVEGFRPAGPAPS